MQTDVRWSATELDFEQNGLSSILEQLTSDSRRYLKVCNDHVFYEQYSWPLSIDITEIMVWLYHSIEETYFFAFAQMAGAEVLIWRATVVAQVVVVHRTKVSRLNPAFLFSFLLFFYLVKDLKSVLNRVS